MPDYAEGWNILGLLYDRKGERLTAAKCYQKSEEIIHLRLDTAVTPVHIELNIANLGLVILLQGNEVEARKQFEKLKSSKADWNLEHLMTMTKQEFMNNIFDEK